MGTACHVAGAPLVAEAFSQELEHPRRRHHPRRAVHPADGQLRRRLRPRAGRTHRRGGDPRPPDAQRARASSSTGSAASRGGLTWRPHQDQRHAAPRRHRARPEAAPSTPRRTTGGEDTVKIRVCAGTTCNASGRAELVAAIAEELEQARPDRQGHGRRDRLSRPLPGGPHRGRPPAGRLLPAPQADATSPRIIETSVVGDGVVERLLYRDPATDEPDRSTSRTCPSTPRSSASCAGINGFIDPTSHRRLPRPRRLRLARQGARRRRPRGRHRRRRGAAACAAAAAPASPPARSGATAAPTPASASTSSATATRATPARSWTAPSSRTTRTR